MCSCYPSTVKLRQKEISSSLLSQASIPSKFQKCGKKKPDLRKKNDNYNWGAQLLSKCTRSCILEWTCIHIDVGVFIKFHTYMYSHSLSLSNTNTHMHICPYAYIWKMIKYCFFLSFSFPNTCDRHFYAFLKLCSNSNIIFRVWKIKCCFIARYLKEIKTIFFGADSFFV